MLSGGSTVSVSVIWFACTVIVQTTPAGRFDVGVKVNDVAGDEVCENASGVPVGQSIENAVFVALTDSLKLISMVVSRATSVAPSAGVVSFPPAASAVGTAPLRAAATLSGGSTVSTSLIPVAITFTEQTVPSGRLLDGSSVIDEPGEPLTEKLSGVPVGQSSENELVVAVTDSLKLTTMLEFTAT